MLSQMAKKRQFPKNIKTNARTKKVKVSVSINDVVNRLFAGDNELLLTDPIERALREKGYDISINAYSIVDSYSANGKINAVINYDDGGGKIKAMKFLLPTLKANAEITKDIQIEYFTYVESHSHDSIKDIDEESEIEYTVKYATNNIPILAVGLTVYDTNEAEFKYLLGLTKQQAKLPKQQLEKILKSSYATITPIDQLDEYMYDVRMETDNTISVRDGIKQMVVSPRGETKNEEMEQKLKMRQKENRDKRDAEIKQEKEINKNKLLKIAKDNKDLFTDSILQKVPQLKALSKNDSKESFKTCYDMKMGMYYFDDFISHVDEIISRIIQEKHFNSPDKIGVGIKYLVRDEQEGILIQFLAILKGVNPYNSKDFYTVESYMDKYKNLFLYTSNPFMQQKLDKVTFNSYDELIRDINIR